MGSNQNFKLTVIAAAVALFVVGGYSILANRIDDSYSEPGVENASGSLSFGAGKNQVVANAGKVQNKAKDGKLPVSPIKPLAPLNTPIPADVSFHVTQSTPIPSDQIILKIKSNSDLMKLAKSSKEKFENALSSVAKVPVRLVRMSGQAAIVKFSYEMKSIDGLSSDDVNRVKANQFETIASAIRGVHGVEGFEEDVVMHPSASINDPYFPRQWSLGNVFAGASNAAFAWDKTFGKPANGNVVVAVIDTGITQHSDLNANVLPGYDFIMQTSRSNDGDGRDSDASDNGDAVSSEETLNTSSPFYGCRAGNSSWHGTHVAGIVAAVGNNNSGVIGVASGAKILPVRVLGKCGGYLSDVADAIRWSVGLPVDGVPINPNPAKILNLSLGGVSNCDSYLQSAITDATKQGAAVIVASGNANMDVKNFSPANCTGAVAVASVGKSGERAYYSDFGSRVMIAAPGGDAVADSGDTIYSTLNSGTNGPGGESYANYQGTSMAAPVVSGGVALLLAANPKMTAGTAVGLLTKTAKSFPLGSTCYKLRNCGAGIIDIGKAVGAADKFQPDLVISKFMPSTGVIVPNVAFDAMITVGNTGLAALDANHQGKVEVYIAGVDGANPIKIGEADTTKVIGALQTKLFKSFRITGLKIGEQTLINNLAPGQYGMFARFIPTGDWELNSDNNLSSMVAMSYVQPEITLTKKQLINQAPSEVAFTAHFNDERISRIAIGSDWVYDWHFDSGELIKAQNGVAKVIFTKPTTGVATLNLRHIPSGFQKTATIPYEVIQAAPTKVTFTESFSNPLMKAPLMARFMPTITAGHPLDRVTSISWDLGNGVLNNRSFNVYANYPAGKYTVRATAMTKMGYSASFEKVIEVVENQAPSCTLDYSHPAGQSIVTFIANCTDVDGVIRAIGWTVNGKGVSASFGQPNILKYPVAGNGTLNVIVKAMDDSKATGEAQITVGY